MNAPGVWPWLVLLALLVSTGCEPSVARMNSSGADHPPGGTLEKTFDDLKFPMEKTDPYFRSLLTPTIEELFGKRIRIRGFMYPTLKRKGLTAFVLVRDNLECCFGPGAALFDCIRVLVRTGESAEYSFRPVTVTGVLKYEEFTDFDGVIRAIYLLEDSQVE
jgi:hypothetical protein